MRYTDADVERVAIAIYKADPCFYTYNEGEWEPSDFYSDDLEEHWREIARKQARAALDAMEREPEENPYTGMTIAEAWTVIAEDLRDVLIERQHELEKPDDPLQLAYATLTGVWVEWRSYYVPDYGCYEADAAEVDLVKAGEAIRNAVAAAKGGE